MVEVNPATVLRRIPYVTFHVFRQCGVIFHQTYNQHLPLSESALAEQAKHKELLGFHDIRVGNEPDARLLKFMHVNLPNVLQDARNTFDAYRDLLGEYSAGGMVWEEFSARVRRRSEVANEDHDWDDEDEYP